MYEILENLDLSEEISKEKLLVILKRESDSIHITDIMTSYVQLVEDGKYVQSGYRREYLEAYIKGFLMRVKEIKDDKTEYGDGINIKDFQEAFKTLKEQEKMVEKERSLDSNFFKIYKIVSIYTTFILEEPIHIVGTLFPGGFRVKLENGTYYCPVKEKQKDNPEAVCGFCIAEQDEDVL